MSALKVTTKIVISALMGALFLLMVPGPTMAAEIVINEVFANPVNEDDEFVELYNLTDNAVEITGLKLADLSKTYIIPEATISGKSFYVLGKITTKIALNNDGDETVSLKDKSDQVIDSFSYNDTVEGKSFSRIKDGENNWITETEPTKNVANQAPPSPSPTPSPSPSPSPSPTPALSPSPSPTPKPTPSPRQSPSPSAEPSRTDLEGMPELSTPTGEVLGETEASPAAKKKNSFTLSFVLIGLGLGLLAATGVVFVKSNKYNKNL